MKLYLFQNGMINVPTLSHMAPGKGNDPFTIPVLTALVEHPEGYVLVDTGMNPLVWPEFMKVNAVFKPEERIDKKLAEIGVMADQIQYVFLSHMHLDHCGWMTLFPESTFIVREKEMKSAWWPEDRSPGAGGYVFEDYKKTRDYQYIQIPDNADFDIFGDGTLVCIDTKGHTRGHQSLVVCLPHSGKMVLAMDAASISVNYREKVPPGEGIWSSEWGIKAFEKFENLEEKGASIIFGHDPEQCKKLRYAPAFYD